MNIFSAKTRPQGIDSENDIYLIDYWKLIVKRRHVIIGLLLILIAIAIVVILISPRVYRSVVYIRITIPEISVSKSLPVMIQPALSPKGLIDSLGEFDNEKISRVFIKNAADIDSLNITDIISEADLFKVIIKSKKADIIPGVITSLTDYIQEHNRAVLFLRQSRDFLDFQLNELNALHKKYFNFSKKLEGMFSFAAADQFPIINTMKEIDDKEISLRFEQLRIIKEIEKLKNMKIQVAQERVMTSRYPLSPKGIMTLTVCIGLLAGFLLAVIFEYREARKENHD